MSHNKKQTVPKTWAHPKKTGVFRASPLPSKPVQFSIPLCYLASSVGVSRFKKQDVKINCKNVNKLTDLVCLGDIVTFKGAHYRLIGVDGTLVLRKLDSTSPFLVLSPLYNRYEDYRHTYCKLVSYQGYCERIPSDRFAELKHNNFIFLKDLATKDLTSVKIEPTMNVTYLKGRDKFKVEEILALEDRGLITKTRRLTFDRLGRDYIVLL